MTTKAKVSTKAKALGCELIIDSMEIEVVAPKGKLLNGDMHFSAFPLDEGYSKTQIWKTLWYELDTLDDCEGSNYCDC